MAATLMRFAGVATVLAALCLADPAAGAEIGHQRLVRADGGNVRLRIRIDRQTIDGRVPDVAGGEDGATPERLGPGVWASHTNQCEPYNCKKCSAFKTREVFIFGIGFVW